MKWYYVFGGKQTGPISTSELAELSSAGTIDGTTLIWREGLNSWTPLETMRDELPGSHPAEPEEAESEDDDSPYQTPRSSLLPALPEEPQLNQGVPAVFRQAGTLFSQRFGVLMIAYLVVWAPLNFLLGYIIFETGDPQNLMRQMILLQVTDALVGVIALGSVYSVCEATWNGDSPGLGWALLEGLGNWNRLCVVRILVLSCVIAGAVLFIVPGIWISIRLLFVEAIVISEKLSGMQALRRGWALSKDQFWPIFGYFLLGTMVAFMGTTVTQMLFLLLPQDNWLVAAAVQCATSIMQVFLMVYLFVVYKHRRAVWNAAPAGD